MRLYTVSSIDSWTMMKQPGRAGSGKQGEKLIPRLGKNGGPLCATSGLISSLEQCQLFVAQKISERVVSVSKIRVWKGQ